LAISASLAVVLPKSTSVRQSAAYTTLMFSAVFPAGLGFLFVGPPITDSQRLSSRLAGVHSDDIGVADGEAVSAGHHSTALL
jgi:hypothetical protein